MDGTDTPRGATDLDRLLYFITAVVAVLLVVPPALGLAGFDVRDGTLIGGEEPPPADVDDVQILSAFGTGINENRSSVGVVELVVATGNQSIQLQDVTVVWENGQRFELTPAEVNAGHGSFAVSGDTVLEDSTDRAVLRFDLGTSDLSGVDPFGDSLEPGDTVTVSITTAAGAGTSRVLTVPDPLPSGAGVPL